MRMTMAVSARRPGNAAAIFQNDNYHRLLGGSGGRHDARAHWFAEPNTSSSHRSGAVPVDSDRDGQFDEDGPEDLNGDGEITMMRKRDPQGRYKPHPDYPEYLMVRAKDNIFTMDDLRGKKTVSPRA